jgi:serine protein kinase
MEEQPIYVLKAGDELSPVFEHPLGLFDPSVWGQRSSKTTTAFRNAA